MTDTISPVRGALSRAHELAAIFKVVSIDSPVPGAPPDPVRTWARSLADDKMPPHLHFGSLRIRPHIDGTWEPDEEGPRAVVLNVPAPSGEPCDLIAWLPDKPERWWRRTKIAVLLGGRSAEGAEFMDTALYIHSTPDQWLFAKGRGVCVVNWSADLRFWLGGIPHIEANSELLAKRLAKALNRRTTKTVQPVKRHAN